MCHRSRSWYVKKAKNNTDRDLSGKHEGEVNLNKQ